MAKKHRQYPSNETLSVISEGNTQGDTSDFATEGAIQGAPSNETSDVTTEGNTQSDAPSAEIDPKQPVNLELRVGSNESRTPKELTKESIEVSVRKKLAKKTDEEKSDPFVPQAQLENEVIQVAKEKGFPLSRGTEIGARLLARSRRPNG